jgi:hypothetical protein
VVDTPDQCVVELGDDAVAVGIPIEIAPPARQLLIDVAFGSSASMDAPSMR